MGDARDAYCEACETRVTPIRPNPLWYAASAGVWLFIVTAGPFIAVMPPLNFVTIPIFVFAASTLVGRVGMELDREASCPRCGRDVPSTATKLAPAPARERPIERARIDKAS